MNEEQAYKIYVAIKNHFNSESYDYFKYSGQVKATLDSFEARRDKSFFIRAAKNFKKQEYICLLISNFIYSSDMWIGDILSESGNSRYESWKKTIESITYTFKQDLCYVEDYILTHNLNFSNLFDLAKPYPEIVRMCIEKKISLETFCILNKILNFVECIDKKIEERILWEKYRLLTLKYSEFLAKSNLSKYEKIFIEKFNLKNLNFTDVNDTIYTNTNAGDL